MTMAETMLLCVGGSYDGEYLAWDGKARYVAAADRVSFSQRDWREIADGRRSSVRTLVEKETYEVRTLQDYDEHGNRDEIRLLVLAGMKPMGAMRRLVEHYRPRQD